MTKTERNSTSEALSALLDGLTTEQVRFLVARQECATDKEAAEAVGVSASTVYKWPGEVKEAARMMALDGLVTAQHIRRRNLAKAMLVKVAGLDSNDESLRQRVATEIIEWEMGKAAQPSHISGPNGEAVTIQSVELTDEERADRIAAILDAARARRDRQAGGE